MAKESEGLKPSHIFNRGTFAKLLHDLEHRIGFSACLMCSHCARQLSGRSEGFLYGISEVPLGLQTPTIMQSRGLLLADLLCSTSALKALWWKRQSDWQSERVQRAWWGQLECMGLQPVSSCSLMAVRCFGECGKADLATSDAVL